MRLRDCTPYVSCSQGNRHRFIFKLEEIIWWLAGNNVTCTSQVALMVWWRNNRRSLKKIYDTGIGIARFSLRKKPMSDMGKKTYMTGLDPPESKMESTWFPKWWRIEGTTQSSFWLVQIGHLLFSSFLSRWLPCGREPSTKHRITFF